MGITTKLIKHLRSPSTRFATLISMTGVILFTAVYNCAFKNYGLSDWVVIYAMVAAVLILEHFTFQLPPEGTRQSMDSAVFLACIFVYGGRFALTILFLSSIIFALNNRKMAWWKHLANFSIYTMMILGAAGIYHALNGAQGHFDVGKLPAYILALTVYFIINTFLVGCYYFLLYRGSLFQFLKDIMKDTLLAYLCTLLLSMVLAILITNNKLFGLFLFLTVGMVLSHAFRQVFIMYQKVSEKANVDQRTSLFSHTYFEEKLIAQIKDYRYSEQPFSLALLDLDDFKKYNDRFGHPQGDKLLGLFGQMVKTECEGTEITAARYGGEEFALILPHMKEAEAYDFVNRLRKKVNDTPFEGTDVFPHGCISFSAGIVEMKKEIYDNSQLVVLADKALYMSKSKGKNTVTIFGEQSLAARSGDLELDIYEIEQQVKFFLSKDVYTFKHSKRVFSYAVDMAEELGLNAEERRILILGALIHDIGKLEIPRDVLNKKGKLSSDEWEMVKKHVLWGKEIVLATGKYKELVPLVELHHERYDGKGYPHGLKGGEIPRLARMLCVIDSFDAMTTERPYQPTKTFAEAIEELRRCSGTQFDPELAGRFVAYMEKKLTLDRADDSWKPNVIPLE